MNKPTKILPILLMILIGMSLACNFSFSLSDPTPTPSPTQAPPTDTPIPPPPTLPPPPTIAPTAIGAPITQATEAQSPQGERTESRCFQLGRYLLFRNNGEPGQLEPFPVERR